MSALNLSARLPRQPWLARLGQIGFAFFLLKGMLWLIAPLVFYWLT